MIIRRWDRHPKRRREEAELVEIAREAAKIDAVRARLRRDRTTVDFNELAFFLGQWGLDPLTCDVPGLANALLERYTIQRKVSTKRVTPP